MITSAIKKQTSICCSISLNPYMAFQTWNHGKKKEKESIYKRGSRSLKIDHSLSDIHLANSLLKVGDAGE